MGEQKEHVFGEGEGPHVVLKMGRKKVPSEQISPTQWSCGNVKILLELLRRGHLQKTAMFHCVAYTVKRLGSSKVCYVKISNFAPKSVRFADCESCNFAVWKL